MTVLMITLTLFYLIQHLFKSVDITRINKQYHAEWAGNYKEPIDSRIHLSVAISKDENISKSNIDLNDDYTCVFVEYEKYKFAGVHLLSLIHI